MDANWFGHPSAQNLGILSAAAHALTLHFRPWLTA